MLFKKINYPVALKTGCPPISSSQTQSKQESAGSDPATSPEAQSQCIDSYNNNNSMWRCLTRPSVCSFSYFAVRDVSGRQERRDQVPRGSYENGGQSLFQNERESGIGFHLLTSTEGEEGDEELMLSHRGGVNVGFDESSSFCPQRPPRFLILTFTNPQSFYCKTVSK